MIIREVPGVDDAEKLKRLIFTAFTSLGIRYVFLAGDAEVGHIPVPHYHVDVTSTPGHDIQETYNPTDFYYSNVFQASAADFFASWNQNQEGLYNRTKWGTSALDYNPDKVAAYPDLVVGRVPASTKVQLDGYVARVISYETQWQSGANRYSFFAGATYPNRGSTLAMDYLESVADVTDPIQGSMRNKFGLDYDTTTPMLAGWQRGDGKS